MCCFFKIIKKYYIGIMVLEILILFSISILNINIYGKEKVNLVLYSSMKETQLIALKKGFSNKYSDINLVYYTAGTGEIMDTLLNEEKEKNIKADVLWVGDPTYYYILKERGLLLPYKSKEALTIPTELKDKDNYFCAARIVTLGLIYNINTVKNNIPVSWKDIIEPSFYKEIIMADPAISGTTLYTLATLIQNNDYGWNYIYDLKRNRVALAINSNEVIKEVGNGRYNIGIGVIYIAKTMKELGLPVDYIYPEDGIITVPSPIAIIKFSSNIEAAKKLYDYIISIEGQLILMEENVIPVRPEVKLKDSISIKEAVKRSLPVDLNLLLYEKTEMLKNFEKLMNGN
jgi:iron(III) transport system substrate-binding protein